MRTIMLLLLIIAVPAGAETTQWYTYEEGMVAAGINKKPAIIEFYADWCPPCVAMEQRTFPDPGVVLEMKDFIAIKVDTQERIDIERKYGVEYYPTVILLNPEGKEVSRYIGYLGPEEMVEWIKESRGKLPKETPGFGVIPALLAVLFLAAAKNRPNR